MKTAFSFAWIALLVWSAIGCFASGRPNGAHTPQAGQVDRSSAAYVRVAGQPDVELVSPDGKRMRARAGAVLQNDFGSLAEAYSVVPNTQMALIDPAQGTWRLRVQSDDTGSMIVQVVRSLSYGKRVCEDSDTIHVKYRCSQWWSLHWSNTGVGDSCWVSMTRGEQDSTR